MQQTSARRSDVGGALVAVAAIALFLVSATASAAPPPLLWQSGEPGTGAGQFEKPRGIAVDRDNGHVFVADQVNQRVVEFNPLGEFEKTWGWDVVQSGPGNSGTGFEICVPENGDSCKAGTEGTGAGQFRAPQGVAVDSAGNVYVVDLPSRRVQKFNRAGEFLLAWGGDVVFDGPDDSATDEEQELTVAATSGSFRLGLPNVLIPGSAQAETAPLPFSATAAQIKAALDALPTIGGLGGSVSVTGAASPYLITFGGKLAGDDVPRLSVTLDVGSTLKCSSPTAAAAISYQWLRNGEPIEGATTSTYIATENDEGAAIQCQVTAANANAGSVDVANPAHIIAPAPAGSVVSPPASIAAPTASAPLSVGSGGGQTLSCDPNRAGWRDVDSEFFRYRWYRNGVRIEEADRAEYQVTAADLAAPAVFQCTVRAGGPGGSSAPAIVRASASLATVPAPSAPPAPEAQASTSPANNVVVTVADGGGPEVCKPADSCKAGTEGAANGEFGKWRLGSFIAIDPSDNVYVGDQERIQRFDTGGVYQGGITLPGRTVGSLAVDASGNLYVVADGFSGIFKFSPSGEPLSPTFKLPAGGGGSIAPNPTAIAVDAAGNVYAVGPILVINSGGRLREPIDKFDPAGNLLESFGKGEFSGSTGLATNLCPGSEAPGNLLITNLGAVGLVNTKDFVRAYGTQPNGCFKALTGAATAIAETSATLNGTLNPNGSLSSECRFQFGTSTTYGTSVPCAESPAAIGEGTSPVPVHVNLASLQAGTVYHYRLLAKVKGVTEKGADRSFKTLGPPVISDDHTASVTDTEATLEALVNPEGFPTTYRFEYGPDASYGQSSGDVSIGPDRSEHPVSAAVEGLAPGTAYHWRIVAENASSEKAGQPTEGEDHILITYRPFAADTDCPNQTFRSAAAAFLPDCRAYEMVSPVDKSGTDIANATEAPGSPGGYIQASPDGKRITYASVGTSFAGQPNSFAFNQYLATREAEGWSTQGIHPPVTGSHAKSGGVLGINREFSAFSSDLCSAWLVDQQTPPISPDGQAGNANLYRRQNCGAEAGSLEALVPATTPLPPGTEPDYVSQDSVEGISDDSRHVLFRAHAALAFGAASSRADQLYDRFEGANQLVSVLPSGSPSYLGSIDSTVGGGSSLPNLDNAVAADGSGVYWTVGFSGFGKIYLRLHPEQGKVPGECAPGIACTLTVSANLSTPAVADDARFWTAAEDGSKALYSEGDLEKRAADLYEFDLAKAVESQSPRLIATGLIGVAGAADDLSRIYFVSNAVLPGAGENNEGEEAVDGKPNFYLDEGGEVSYIATLEEGDTSPGPALFHPYNVAALQPYTRATRLTPDGGHIVFESRAPLTGYDNTDAATGEADVEVFSYAAESGELTCISCNPSGARPTGRPMPAPYRVLPKMGTSEIDQLTHRAAAWIPTWEHPLHASNVLSADGNRIFFNSNDALLLRDTNGTQDVYQWEAAGKGHCDSDDPDHFPQNGGCLSLVSSGESSFESEFWEASPDGSDAFFTTESSLLPQDPGLVDLYDARVGGGFPQPPERASCEGEACQSPATPPNDPTPASSSFQGPGNPGQRPGSCRKGKVRRKGRCVSRKAAKTAKRHRGAKHERRAKR